MALSHLASRENVVRKHNMNASGDSPATERPTIDRSSLNLASRCEMGIESIDIAGTSAVIVDNVFANPDAVRGLALSLDFHRDAGLYPGFLGFVSLQPVGLLELLNDLLEMRLGR